MTIETTPPCRVCKKNEPVLCYHPDRHEQAICPECCGTGIEHENGETGHEWEYDKFQRDHACTHCGIFRSSTDHDYSEDL